jgi:DNA-directed RNA polymerase specialized sigma24 family protein
MPSIRRKARIVFPFPFLGGPGRSVDFSVGEGEGRSRSVTFASPNAPYRSLLAESSSEGGSDFRTSARLIRRSISQVLRTSSNSMSDDDQEVVQIVFLKLVEILRGRCAVAALTSSHYVRAMARNATLDLLRSRRRYLFVSEVVDRPCDEDIADLADEASLSALEAYTASLPSDLVGVFTTRFVKKLSQVQACRELTISRQHLRTLEGRLKRYIIRFVRARERS